MPCVTCSKIFKVKPCDHPTGKFNDKSEIYHYANTTIYNIIEHYYNLHVYCPCKICLVRPACYEASNCQKFKERMSPNTHYNDRKSRFTFTDTGWCIVRMLEEPYP